MALEIEEWRSTLNGGYEVSQIGRVRRSKPGRGKTFVGRIMTPFKMWCGHMRIGYWKDGKRKRVLVHVLVAEAFIGPRPEGKEINHIDGDPTNNHVSNLEYITHAENIKHGYRDKKGEKHHCSILRDTQIEEVVSRRKSGERGADLAREFGISQQLVCDYYKGRKRGQ